MNCPKATNASRVQLVLIITSRRAHEDHNKSWFNIVVYNLSGYKLVTINNTFRATELTIAAESLVVLEIQQSKSKNGALKNTQPLTTRYNEPGQGLVVPFGLINTLVSVSFTISVNPGNLPASPAARRTFCNLNTTLRISAMVCTAYSTPAQLWNPAPLRLYDAFGRVGSMAVGLGNSLGWEKRV